MKDKEMFRKEVPAPPEGVSRFRWYGPGLLWMVSAVGTGSILFTPRVAALYSYELLWLLLVVVLFMWVMIRETARFSVVSGCSVLEGMHTLGGPRNWAVWVIFVPQLFAAAIGIAGLSAVVGSALGSTFPGGNALYGVLTVLLCTAFNITGRYQHLEMLSRFMALGLLAMALISAGIVFPGVPKVANGLIPRWPADADLYVIMPWVGTILAGSMGIIWFSYWSATRGYGGGLVGRERDDERPESVDEEHRASEAKSHSTELKVFRSRAWIRVMSNAAVLGVVMGGVVIVSFLVLGAELLAPEGNVPQGTDVAIDLTRLFSGVWGEMGRWVLLSAITVALVGSVLANQDGWGRSFADITLILIRGRRRAEHKGVVVDTLHWLEAKTGLPMLDRLYLKRGYIAVVTGAIPMLILLVFKDPVAVMSASGIIAAIHTPFIVLVVLFVNLTRLPKALQPGFVYTGLLGAAGLFYLAFGVYYGQQFFMG